MAGTNIITTQVVIPTGNLSTTTAPTASGSRFFSKLARSPTSRKHKPSASVNSSGSGSDTIREQVPEIPDFYVQNEAAVQQAGPQVPNSQVTLVVTPESPLSRSHSDSKGKRKNYSTQGDGSMLDIGLSAAMLRPPGPGDVNGKVAGVAQPVPVSMPMAPATIPNYQLQQLQDVATKRIATLEYMRKAHEGKKYWFNSVHFSKPDISKLPSYSPTRLSRRAMNYLLLGLSIPVVLDVHPQPHGSNTASTNAALAVEILRSLNALLTEFDAYQTLHPTDGSHVSSLSRARIPQMFKRATTTSRPRKSSGVPDITQPSQISPPAIPDGHHHHMTHGSDSAPGSSYMSSTAFAASTPTLVNGSPATPHSTGSYPTSSSFPPPGPADSPNSNLLPNEGPYTYLLTPSLPFIPDFYSVFATLCDVLTDVYQRVLQIINSPAACTVHVVEAFGKVDARVRKIMVGGIIRDFEGQARETARREIMGVQKVVLGGLMAA